MTREEAIKFANCLKNNYTIDFNDMADFCEMAIKALQQQPSENEKIIRISKGTLKARTGKYVIYDVEWLKTHFNTTEAKIYGQPSENEDCISRKEAIDGLASIAKVKAKSDAQKSLMGRVMFFTEHLPSVTPQPETEGARGDIPLQQSVPKMPQSEKRTEERTETHECDYISRKGYWIEHKHGGIEHIECSKCKCWFLRKNLIRNSYCPNCGSYNGGTK